MVKSLLIEDEIHEMIKNKIKEIKDKYGIEPRISDLVNKVLRENVQKYDIKEAI